MGSHGTIMKFNNNHEISKLSEFDYTTFDHKHLTIYQMPISHLTVFILPFIKCPYLICPYLICPYLISPLYHLPIFNKIVFYTWSCHPRTNFCSSDKCFTSVTSHLSAATWARPLERGHLSAATRAHPTSAQSHISEGHLSAATWAQPPWAHPILARPHERNPTLARPLEHNPLSTDLRSSGPRWYRIALMWAR